MSNVRVNDKGDYDWNIARVPGLGYPNLAEGWPELLDRANWWWSTVTKYDPLYRQEAVCS
jgi:hypothetical protein